MSSQNSQYEDQTSEELHDELASRGLAVSGTKDERAARLEEDDASKAKSAKKSDAKKVDDENEPVASGDAIEQGIVGQPSTDVQALADQDGKVVHESDGTVTMPGVIAGHRLNSQQIDDIRREYQIFGKSDTEQAIRDGAKKSKK